MPERIARLTRHGADVFAAAADIQRARACFEHDYAVHLPGLIDPDLLAFVRRQIDLDGFHTRVHDRLPSRPTDLMLHDGMAAAVLALITNNVRFLELARLVTGHPEIQSFNGVVHRRVPGAGHDDEWHHDLTGGRLATLTINVGSEPFEGGVLQIREEPDGANRVRIQERWPG